MHTSTGISPFALNLGFNPRCDYLENNNSNLPAVATHLENIRSLEKVLSQLLKNAAQNYKRFADRKRKDVEFKLGELVMLNRKNIKTTRPSDKLDYRKIGPFQITEKINEVAYRLKLPENLKIHDVFHVSLLEKYYESKIPDRYVPPPPPIEIDDDLEFEVEAILDSRIRRKKLEYLIKWKGYSVSENSWETIDNVLPGAAEMVNDFHAKNPSSGIRSLGRR